MAFDSPPPPDPDNRPWLDVLHLRTPNPDHCYLSESRWQKKSAAKNAKTKAPARKKRAAKQQPARRVRSKS